MIESNSDRVVKHSFAVGCLFGLFACGSVDADDPCGTDCLDGTGSSGVDSTSVSSSDDASSADGSTGSESDGSESGDVPVDGCTNELAHDVVLRDLAFFQVVGIHVLEDGLVLPPQDRVAPLIQSRDAILRARVEVGSDAEPRELGARIELSTGRSFLDTRMIDASSDGVFVVDLPADAMQADMTYSVSIVECGAPPAGAPSPQARFPPQGTDALAPVKTGPLAIHVVPFEIGGFVPDTSPQVIDGFRNAILSVYPVTDVEVTVGEVVPDQDGGVVDMGALLVRLGVLQEQEVDAPDIYYYGMVTGAATREEFCDECPTGTSESGLGDRAAFAIGAAFADQKSEDTLIHELGHMHGLLHAPCGEPEDVDPLFPYDEADIMVEGYDFRTDAFVPPDRKDMMAYCYPRWISDYNYAKLVDWVQLAQTWAGRADGATAPSEAGAPFRCFDNG